MLPANINITNSISDWEIKLKASLEQAGFKHPERQGKIIGDIANELQKKGTTKPIERDIFEAASEVYKFNNEMNLGLAKAIDELDGETNIQLSESNAKWQLVGANNKNSSSGSIPDWEIKLQASLKQAGFNGPERQGKIIGDIANELQKKGTTKPIERDIFEAASKVYKFNNKINLGLAKAIDGLDGEINIDLSGSKVQWTGTGAVINKDEREQPNDSRNIIGRSIERIKAKNGTTEEITVENIIEDLLEKKVIEKNKDEIRYKNQHLYDNLQAMRDQGVTAEEIREAIKDDEGWNKLIGTVKKTEFQRGLIEDSINRIKKTDFKVDDIIEDLKKEKKLDDELRNNLMAIKDQGVTAEEIREAIKDDEGWNKLIGPVKKAEFLRQFS